jgi:hypothetical protein
MPIRWETFPIELTGGLVSNLSRLQHGLKLPGSARVLQNFEPSTKGGYRRINGFAKFDTAVVPAYGSVVVQGSAQSGTTLLVADTHETPVVGDTFTLAGVTGTYTVTVVSYSSANKSATLTITPAMDSSPADKAIVTFTLGQSRIEGVHYSEADVVSYVLRGGTIWRSSGSGWTKVSTPSYGSPLVAGGSQTGSSLDVDALGSDTYKPQPGDTFSVAGVELVYTVTAIPTVTSGVATLAISPALDTSPADNAAITFLSSSHTGGVTARFRQFNFDGSLKTAMVDSAGKPAVFTSTTYKTLQGVADVVGAQYVEEFKNHLFFAKDDLISHTAPLDEDDFLPGNGAGGYRLPGPCTGLITFREQLVNFSQTDIRKLLGTSLADFTLSSITNDIGCIAGDTVKEVGGDVLFLGPDGVRFLGATERIGDFNLALASRQIQEDLTKFIKPDSTYTTSVFREKNQYRVFEYKQTKSKVNSQGFIGTQFMDQNSQSINWGTTRGIKVYRSSSSYVGDTEVSLFSNDDEYLYQMDTGSTFDGTAILGLLYTPFMAINDPSIRKTAYKLDTFFDPEGVVAGKLTLRYDFNKPGKVQPVAVPVTGGGLFNRYGTAVYGTSTYSSEPTTSFENQVVGSFFTVSLQYEFEGGDPFVLDTAILEYSTSDRK